MRIIKKLIWFVLISFLIVTSIAIGYYIAVTKEVNLDHEKLLLSGNELVIYDKNGQTVKNVASFLPKQSTKTGEIPLHTKLAFVNTEDKRFYKHDGFDGRRILKAAWNNLKAHSFKEGASTISQQLIKNTHLTQEKTIKRKLQEWKLTKQLEKNYSKEEILEKYLASIYFGHNCFGIRAAADFYFGKTIDELSLADSAILAGLVKSPNNYSPFKNPENCKRRKEIVLSIMFQNGSITQSEKSEAINAPLPLSKGNSRQNEGYLSFVFDELGVIAENENLILNGKIEISTDFDPLLQADLEEVAKSIECDKTLLALDPQNRNFTACVSSVGNICRLPGSLIKPLLVYAPALEENILTPATPILDEKINFGGYNPENYDGKFHGYVSARESVAKSLNIPAVKTLQTLGVKKGISYLNKMGLETQEGDNSLALALGGMKKGFTLRDIAAAYSILQNGERQDCGFISEIKLNDACVYKKNKNKTRIFSQESAYLMTDMLKTTAMEGTAKKLRTLPFEIAAKTGTVGTKNGNTDAYALSYTTRNLLAVWVGNADNHVIEHTGGGLPCNLLTNVNERLYNRYKEKDESIPNFPTPKGIQKVSLDKLSYYDTHNIMLSDDLSPAEYRFEELFKSDSIPVKKSDFFSNPSILQPSIEMTKNGVCITFDKRSPKQYSYKIDRYDYVTHTTVYEGNLISEFIDSQIEKDKTYLYTVTPIYRDREGSPIPLPYVNTRSDFKIINKEWWKY